MRTLTGALLDVALSGGDQLVCPFEEREGERERERERGETKRDREGRSERESERKRESERVEG